MSVEPIPPVTMGLAAHTVHTGPTQAMAVARINFRQQNLPREVDGSALMAKH
jgi:hypothetical protein